MKGYRAEAEGLRFPKRLFNIKSYIRMKIKEFHKHTTTFLFFLNG